MAQQSLNLPKVDPEEILDGIREWVEVETPSYEGREVNELVDLVERNMAAIGARIERTPGRDGFGDILKTRTPWGGDGPRSAEHTSELQSLMRISYAVFCLKKKK